MRVPQAAPAIVQASRAWGGDETWGGSLTGDHCSWQRSPAGFLIALEVLLRSHSLLPAPYTVGERDVELPPGPRRSSRRHCVRRRGSLRSPRHAPAPSDRPSRSTAAAPNRTPTMLAAPSAVGCCCRIARAPPRPACIAAALTRSAVRLPPRTRSRASRSPADTPSGITNANWRCSPCQVGHQLTLERVAEENRCRRRRGPRAHMGPRRAGTLAGVETSKAGSSVTMPFTIRPHTSNPDSAPATTVPAGVLPVVERPLVVVVADPLWSTAVPHQVDAYSAA